MAPYQPTHVPYGLSDPKLRTITNPKFDDRVVFDSYGQENNGTFFKVTTWVGPNGGVPLHIHWTYGETFIPTKGTLGVNGQETADIGRNSRVKEILLKPGETYTVRPGEVHRFFNPSATEEIEFEATVAPAHDNFEKLLHIVYGLAEDGLVTEQGLPRSMVHMSLFVSMAEVSYPTWSFFFMRPMLAVLSWWARVSGEQERLVRRYYGMPVGMQAEGRKDR